MLSLHSKNSMAWYITDLIVTSKQFYFTLQAFKRSGRLFVVKPVMIFYALSFAVTMSITRLGILYTSVMFIIVDNYSTDRTLKWTLHSTKVVVGMIQI